MTNATNDTPTKIIRKPEVMERTGLSNVTLWRLERAGDFPRRRKLTGRAVGWFEHEVEEWLQNREPAELKDSEPEE